MYLVYHKFLNEAQSLILKGFTYQPFESAKMYFACLTSFAKKNMNNNSINIIVKTSQILSFYFGFNLTFTERAM